MHQAEHSNVGLSYPSIKYVYCTDTILDMHDDVVQNITEESINRVKNERDVSYPEKKDSREAAKKPSPVSTTTSTKASPMKSEVIRSGMDMEMAK